MRTTDIAKSVARHFRENNFTWKMGDGSLSIPTPADLEFMFDQIIERLGQEDDANRIEVGRLVVIKDDEHTDLYVYFGEI